MTTLVALQQPLQLLSMSEKPVRRSKRQPAATAAAVAADYEQDDDFHFVRKSKRARTDAAPAEKEREVPEEEPQLPVRRTGRGVKESGDAFKDEPVKVVRRVTRRAARMSSDGLGPVEEEPKVRRGRKAVAVMEREEVETRPKRQGATLAEDEEPRPKRNGRGRAALQHVELPAEEERPRKSGRGRGKTKAVPVAAEREESPPPPVPIEAVEVPTEAITVPPEAEPAPTESVAKIALPMSDTPIINRNKEMRKKGAGASRRSSLGSRGRRASSLIESGQAAIPHREVDAAEFYKHIAAEGLPEPRRMKQLLMWCGERALSAKPAHGNANSSAILGARAIQDQLLKDFANKSECSDWFSREEEAPRVPVVVQPNPRNLELDEKMQTLRARIQRLQEEKKAWLAIRRPPPELPPVFTSDEGGETVVLPDFSLLDPDEARIREDLADEGHSMVAARRRTEARVRKVQASLEFAVDQLADNVHRLEQRVGVAGREADAVLALSARRLREREERERSAVGTGGMPLMEVLRSLSCILPEGERVGD